MAYCINCAEPKTIKKPKMELTADTSRIRQLAETALRKAEEHCRLLNLDPTPHKTLLTNLVIQEIKTALADIAHDRTHGGPAMAYALAQPFFQEIYFNDGSRKAAEALATQLQEQHLRPPRQIH